YQGSRQVGDPTSTPSPVGRSRPVAASRPNTVTELDRWLATRRNSPTNARSRGQSPPVPTSSTSLGSPESPMAKVAIEFTPRLATYKCRPSADSTMALGRVTSALVDVGCPPEYAGGPVVVAGSRVS